MIAILLVRFGCGLGNGIYSFNLYHGQFFIVEWAGFGSKDTLKKGTVEIIPISN